MSLDKPAPPQDLTVSRLSDESVTLEWVRPSDDGGSKVKQYVVEKRDAFRMAWQPVATTADTSLTIDGLTEGQHYVFRVSAENDIGRGHAEELPKAITAKSPHGTSSLIQFSVLRQLKGTLA